MLSLEYLKRYRKLEKRFRRARVRAGKVSSQSLQLVALKDVHVHFNASKFSFIEFVAWNHLSPVDPFFIAMSNI